MAGEENSWVEYRKLILEELKDLNAASHTQMLMMREMDKTLMIQASQLKDHMRRTEAAESNLIILNNGMAEITRQRWLMSLIVKAVLGCGSALIGVMEFVRYLQGK